MISTHAPETDLIFPLPARGERWDPHTIHTHYFGFGVAEAGIGVCAYLRYQPVFASSQGGVSIFRGMGNVRPLDMEFLDYQITMPYPEIDGTTVQTENGLRLEFLEPGRVIRVSYSSTDEQTSFEVTFTAVTPLIARGEAVPGESDHADLASSSGGFEQAGHCIGEMVVRGERFEVDCHTTRDRSWRQVRTEDQGGARVMPPVGWSPMYFGEDLIFCCMSFEAPDSDPPWSGLYEVPEGAPNHVFGWVARDGDLRSLLRVRRTVSEHHPECFIATRQEIEAEDERGELYRFRGEALAASPLPAWPNVARYDTVYRWENEDGRIAHASYQEFWVDTYQRALATEGGTG